MTEPFPAVFGSVSVEPATGSRSPRPLQRVPRRDADIEAAAVVRVVTLPPPADEALHQIALIEPAADDQAIGDAQRHAVIVDPEQPLQPKTPLLTPPPRTAGSQPSRAFAGRLRIGFLSTKTPG